MRVRSKNALLQDLRTYEGMKKDEEKGSNIRGSVVYWRMNVSWYVILRDTFNFKDEDIQRILGLITNKDIYNMPKDKREQIIQTMHSKDCECFFANIVEGRKTKGNVIAQTIFNLENYNAEISINYCLLMFDYLMRYQKFDGAKLDRCINDISFLDMLSSNKIWEYREEIYDQTGFWIAIDREGPEEVFGKTFNEYSKNTIGFA